MSDSTFHNTCPKKLKNLPRKPCALGKAQDDSKCPWWIASEEHHYCFWKLLKEESDKDGDTREFPQSELMDLFNVSNTKMHLLMKESMEHLEAQLRK